MSTNIDNIILFNKILGYKDTAELKEKYEERIRERNEQLRKEAEEEEKKQNEEKSLYYKEILEIDSVIKKPLFYIGLMFSIMFLIFSPITYEIPYEFRGIYSYLLVSIVGVFIIIDLVKILGFKGKLSAREKIMLYIDELLLLFSDLLLISSELINIFDIRYKYKIFDYNVGHLWAGCFFIFFGLGVILMIRRWYYHKCEIPKIIESLK